MAGELPLGSAWLPRAEGTQGGFPGAGAEPVTECLPSRGRLRAQSVGSTAETEPRQDQDAGSPPSRSSAFGESPPLGHELTSFLPRESDQETMTDATEHSCDPPVTVSW